MEFRVRYNSGGVLPIFSRDHPDRIGLGWLCFEMRNEKEHSEREVDDHQRYPGLRKESTEREYHESWNERELFQRTENHGGMKPLRITGNHQEEDLPHDGETDETIIVFRMTDCRGVVDGYFGFHEKKWKGHQKAIDTRNQKDEFREFQSWTPLGSKQTKRELEYGVGTLMFRKLGKNSKKLPGSPAESRVSAGFRDHLGLIPSHHQFPPPSVFQCALPIIRNLS